VSTQIDHDRTRVRAWIQRLTLFRAIRTIVAIAALLVLAGGVLVRILEPETFTSIGLAFWWAVTTVTTVGYGDVVPATSAARVVGAVLMLAGVSLIPIVTSVAVSILTAKRTQLVYEQQDARLARIEERVVRLGASPRAVPPSEPAEAPPPPAGPS
jgi:voltage-gated potassium channel Kch